MLRFGASVNGLEASKERRGSGRFDFTERDNQLVLGNHGGISDLLF
jgi:hypothetical protein